MLQKFEIKGVHTTVDDNLRKYVTKKIGRLDRYIPRSHRDSVHVIVELKESSAKDRNRYTCAANIRLPKAELVVTESTMNMYAAVDIVEAKLRQSIARYKAHHPSGKLVRHLTARLRRANDRPMVEPAEAA